MSIERETLTVDPMSDDRIILVCSEENITLMRLDFAGIRMQAIELWPHERRAELLKHMNEAVRALNISMQEVARAFNQIIEPTRISLERLLISMPDIVCEMPYIISDDELHPKPMYPLRKRKVFTHIVRTHRTGGRAAKFR